MILRIAGLLLIATAIAITVNAASPVGLEWNVDWSGTMAARAQRAGIEPIALADLARWLDERDDLLLLDTRPEPFFHNGHLPTARSAPWHRGFQVAPIDRHQFRDRTVIVYCASAYCDIGLLMAMQLREAGVKRVGLLVEGYDGWVLAGRPVERNDD